MFLNVNIQVRKYASATKIFRKYLMLLDIKTEVFVQNIFFWIQGDRQIHKIKQNRFFYRMCLKLIFCRFFQENVKNWH